MAANKALSDWIAAALAETGKTQKGLARALRVDPAIANRIVKGTRNLKVAEVALVERYLDMRIPAEIEDDIEGETKPFAPDGYASVPVYDLRAAAGAGAVAVDAEPINYRIFNEGELRSISSDVSQLFILEISGDSGLPTLHSGDHALVDRGQVNPRHEGLYVIRLDDVQQVKRLSMHPVSKLLTIRSENDVYPSYPDINPDEVAIVGRVIWIGRKLV